MCKRFALDLDWNAIAAQFSVAEEDVRGDVLPRPSYNIAPTQNIAVIAAVTICLSASMAVGWGDTGLILVVLVIRSAGGGIQTPAVQSFIPQIVPEAWLLRVNAINGTLQTAISIASPAIAAALVNLMPLWMIMLVDVSTAIVGIGFVALIRLDDARLRRPGESSDDALRATSISVSSCSPISLTGLPRPRTRSCKRRATCPCRGGYWVC